MVEQSLSHDNLIGGELNLTKLDWAAYTTWISSFFEKSALFYNRLILMVCIWYVIVTTKEWKNALKCFFLDQVVKGLFLMSNNISTKNILRPRSVRVPPTGCYITT